MTATAYEDVIQNAVKKGKGVKKEVLEELKIEKEITKEHEIDKEVEKRIREGELSKIEYPHGDSADPITMVRNPEDEVYGNLPMSFKVDIADAVNFIEAWDNAKPTDMRAAFMRSHLTNKVKDEYFEELRKRLEVAKRQGHSQVIMPTPNQEMVSEMEDKEKKEGKGNSDDLVATLAPLLTLQKVMGGDENKESQEKPTEIVKTIMETAKGISEGKEKPESQTELVKGIVEIAKELNEDKGSTLNPIELVNAIVAAAGVMAQPKQAETQQSPDVLQQISAVSDLINSLSNKDNGGKSEDKIQVPREDGSMMEMTVQQYMLSEMLRAKLANAQQPQHTQDQKQQYDTIQIQDPDGSVRTMPATTYISELALKRMSEKEEQTARRPSETEKVSQDNTKLMAALVATVERLSNEVSNIRAQDKKSDPIQMMDSMLAQGEKIDNFRRRFLGGGLTEDDKKRDEEELEKQRAHELRLVQMQAQQANRNALTQMLNSGESMEPKDQPLQESSPKQPEPKKEIEGTEREKEVIRQSQRRAEQMIEHLARERGLAEKAAEEEETKQRVRRHTKPTPKRTTTSEQPQEGKAKATETAEGKAKVREEEVKEKKGKGK